MTQKTRAAPGGTPRVGNRLSALLCPGRSSPSQCGHLCKSSSLDYRTCRKLQQQQQQQQWQRDDEHIYGETSPVFRFPQHTIVFGTKKEEPGAKHIHPAIYVSASHHNIQGFSFRNDSGRSCGDSCGTIAAGPQDHPRLVYGAEHEHTRSTAPTTVCNFFVIHVYHVSAIGSSDRWMEINRESLRIIIIRQRGKHH